MMWPQTEIIIKNRCEGCYKFLVMHNQIISQPPGERMVPAPQFRRSFRGTPL